MDSLRNMPPGAAYVVKSGQTGLKLEVKDNKLHATATCDSLQQLVFQIEEELHQARDQLEQQTIETKPAGNPLKYFLNGVLAGIILAISFYLLIKYKRKW